MKIRMNMDSCKNALGTVFLLATAFFVCSTFISMRSVFADPILQNDTNAVRSNRQTTRTNRQTTPKRTVARTVSSRTVASQPTTTKTTTTTPSRSVASRSIATNRTTNSGTTRNVVSRQQNSVSARNTNNRAVRARTSTTPSRVSVTNSAMAAGSGLRAGSTTYTYLTSKLYSGTYSSIIDSSTGLISADAYSNCLDAYYTCMDEICTARSDTKGRCSCAGRATNFLEAETKLEEANEELIKLSGQLSLLVATKGEGDDLAAAFSLTDAEKVMNCVSWKETVGKYGLSSNEAKKWCTLHNIFASDGGEVSSCGQPSYCSSTGTGANSFGFNLSDIDGSSSDILAQLKAWADAKDLAKQYTAEDTNNLLSAYTTVSGIVDTLTDFTNTDDDSASLDSLANKWGYKLFEYAHNNVCGRVLDSCFNGIYESCGNPGTITDSDGKTHSKCATSATTNCPFNYNSYISIDGSGDVKLNERGSTVAESSVTNCFGYTTTTTSSTTTSSTDPYVAIRGPVADARRSIMQKYLLDANSACDVYGAQLKQTAQNINYQKIAAQQALQQKRLEFKQEKSQTVLSEAVAAANNFDECLSELIDCYETQSGNTTSSGAIWSEARIKTYCAQIAQSPHCYETMICNPSTAQFHAIIDLPDNANCLNDQDYEKNTCRNVVSISEILNGTGTAAGNISAGGEGNSAAMREQCLVDVGVNEIRNWSRKMDTVSCSLAEVRNLDKNAYEGYKHDGSEVCEYVTSCNSGYILSGNKCIAAETDCTSEITGAASAVRTLNNNNTWTACTLQSCLPNYTQNGNTCVADTIACAQATLNAANASGGTQTWNGTSWGTCMLTGCLADYVLINNACVYKYINCTDEIPGAAYARKILNNDGTTGECIVQNCLINYTQVGNTCVAE